MVYYVVLEFLFLSLSYLLFRLVSLLNVKMHFRQYVPPVFARAMEAASQFFARDVWAR